MEYRLSKNWANFFLGLIIALFPFLGLPSSVKDPALAVLGILIALVTLANNRRLPSIPVHESSGAQS